MVAKIAFCGLLAAQCFISIRQLMKDKRKYAEGELGRHSYKVSLVDNVTTLLLYVGATVGVITNHFWPLGFAIGVSISLILFAYLGKREAKA